jgi:hypothetical protein
MINANTPTIKEYIKKCLSMDLQVHVYGTIKGRILKTLFPF